MAAPRLFEGAPAWAQPVLENPLALSTISALALNLILNVGVSNRARAELQVDVGISDSLRRFLERHGASWGARGDVVRRAAPAISEWCEELRQIAGTSTAQSSPAVLPRPGAGSVGTIS